MPFPDFLTVNSDGEIILTGHRIGLYHIVQYYLKGFTVEMLACQYPTAPLVLIHKVVDFYLDNRFEVDQYIAGCRDELDRQQATSDRRIDSAALRQRLDRRRHAEVS